MNSPSLDSAGSPVSSVDASEQRRAVNTSNDISKADESAMLVDENAPHPAAPADVQRKRKSEAAVKDDSSSAAKTGKKANSPKILQSSRREASDASSDEERVAVTSKQIKRPKLADASGKITTTTPARRSASTSSKPTTTASTSAVKDANESHIVQFKNGKLLLKQKKIDFSQQNAALQSKTDVAAHAPKERIDWNGFIEDLETALEDIPSEFHALIALMIHESDKTINELTKSVKNALNPPLIGEEDSEGDDSVEILPFSTVSKAVNLLADRVNHGFRDNQATTVQEDVVTIADSDDEKEAGKSKSISETLKADRDLPPGYDTVPNGLRLFRWEVKTHLRPELFSCLPKDMQDKIEVRANERAAAREEAKKLLAAMPEAEQRTILLKGVKSSGSGAPAYKANTTDKGKENEQGEKKTKPSTSVDKPVIKAKKTKVEDEDGGKSSAERENSKTGRKPKELTEEEKQQKEEERLKKEQEKVEREKRKAEREAAKAARDAAKAEKEAIKAEKEAARARVEDAKKQQKNAFGAWLAKAGTSPVEAINKSGHDSSHYGRASSSSASERGDIPTTSGADPKKGKRPSKDYYSTFKPFYVRVGMEVAPINRFLAKDGSVKQEPAERTERQLEGELSNEESLKEFLSRAALDRIPSSSRTQIQPISSLMAAMQECEIRGDMETYHKLRTHLRNTDKYPFKLIKFHADVRPGYVGTWTKSSTTISGRNPFGRDTSLLDYDYDSEAEWDEDPEDAEDIKEDSGEEEMSESDDDLDGWLAGDDEVEFEAGYDGELSLADMMDDPNDPFALMGQEKIEDGKKRTKKSGRPTIKKKKITGPLIPIIRGPYWQDEHDSESDTSGLSKFMDTFKISWLSKNRDGVLDPFAHVEKKGKTVYNPSFKTVTAAVSADGLSKSGKPASSAGPMVVKKPELPKQLLETFKQIVLSSTTTTKPLLLDELFGRLQGTEHRITKSMLDRAYNTFVDKKKKTSIGIAGDGSSECAWEIKNVAEAA